MAIRSPTPSTLSAGPGPRASRKGPRWPRPGPGPGHQGRRGRANSFTWLQVAPGRTSAAPRRHGPATLCTTPGQRSRDWTRRPPSGDTASARSAIPRRPCLPGRLQVHRQRLATPFRVAPRGVALPGVVEIRKPVPPPPLSPQRPRHPKGHTRLEAPSLLHPPAVFQSKCQHAFTSHPWTSVRPPPRRKPEQQPSPDARCAVSLLSLFSAFFLLDWGWCGARCRRCRRRCRITGGRAGPAFCDRSAVARGRPGSAARKPNGSAIRYLQSENFPAGVTARLFLRP